MSDSSKCQAKENEQTTVSYFSFLFLYYKMTSILDNPIKVNDESVGVTLTEREVPGSTLALSTTPVIESHRADRTNDDIQWTLENMLERYNFIGNVDWSPTDYVGLPIVVYDVLTDMLTTAISSTPFERFQHFRCKSISVRVEIIGNKFCQGRILVYFRPTMMKKSELLDTYTNNSTATTLQRLILDPCQGTTQDLELPFVFNKDYLDLVRGDVLGQLIIQPQVAFTPGATGAPNARLKLFIKINEPQFKQPRPGLATGEILSGKNNPRGITGRQFHPFMRVESGIVDSLVNAGVNEVEKLVSSIVPTNIVQDAIGALLDKPQIGNNHEPFTLKEQGQLSSTRNFDYTESTNLDPSSIQPVEPDMFGCPHDEMSINDLIKTKAQQIDVFEWTSSTTVGTVLYSRNVMINAGFPISFDPTNPSSIPLMDYIGSMFSFWAGGFLYFFDIVGTGFHEGKLDINFHPGLDQTEATSLTYDNSLTQYTRSCYFTNGKNCFGVKVPQLADTPFKKVWRGQNLTTDYNSGDPRLRFFDYAHGSITVRASTYLNAPQTVAPKVDVVVYQMAAEDFVYAFPTLTGISIQPAAEIPTMRSEAGIEDNIDLNRPRKSWSFQTLSAGAGNMIDQTKAQFGENYTSLSELMKRYQPLFSQSIIADISALNSEQKLGIEPILHSFDISQFIGPGGYSRFGNGMGKVGALFRSFRGPLAFKVRVRANAYHLESGLPAPINAFAYVTVNESQPNQNYNQQTSTAFPVPHLSNLPGNQIIPRVLASDRQNAEFKVPFLSNRTFTLIKHAFDAPTGTGYLRENFLEQTLLIAVYIENLPPESILSTYEIRYTFIVDVSFADETRMGTYIGVPKCYHVVNSNDSGAIGPDQWPKPVSGIKQQNSMTKSQFISSVDKLPLSDEQWTNISRVVPGLLKRV